MLGSQKQSAKEVYCARRKEESESYMLPSHNVATTFGLSGVIRESQVSGAVFTLKGVKRESIVLTGA